MGKYGSIISQAKSDQPGEPEKQETRKPESQMPGIPENQITRRPENQKARKMETKKARRPESQTDEEMVNLGVKVPLTWRRHWAAESKRKGVSMTEIIIDALTKRLGKPE